MITLRADGSLNPFYAVYVALHAERCGGRLTDRQRDRYQEMLGNLAPGILADLATAVCQGRCSTDGPQPSRALLSWVVKHQAFRSLRRELQAILITREAEATFELSGAAKLPEFRIVAARYGARPSSRDPQPLTVRAKRA